MYSSSNNPTKIWWAGKKSCKWPMSRRKYQFWYDLWSQASWAQPVLSWMIPYGELGVLLQSNQGLKPTWLLRETGIWPEGLSWNPLATLLNNHTQPFLLPILNETLLTKWRNLGKTYLSTTSFSNPATLGSQAICRDFITSSVYSQLATRTRFRASSL